MRYTFFLLLIFIKLQYTEGFSNIAISTYLNENTQIVVTGWSKISSWSTSLGFGHFTSSTLFSSSDFKVLQSGIYQLFTTITFSGAQNGVFKAALIINNDLVNSHPGLFSSFQDSVGYRSLSVFGTARLFAGDIVSVYVFSELDQNWIVRGGSESTFCIQFISFYDQVPGFSSYLTQEYNIKNDNWNSILKWNVKNGPGLFKSRTGFSADVGKFVAICNGIYLFSANILISASNSGRFDIGIQLNGIPDVSITGADIGADPQSLLLSLSISISLKLNIGDSVAIISRGTQSYSIKTQSGFFGILINDGGTIPGISSVLLNPITRSEGSWVSISIPTPTTGWGQFQSSGDSLINNGRFSYSQTQIFIINAIINVQSSSSTALILSLEFDTSKFSNQIRGLFTNNRRTSINSSYSISGILEIRADNPLFMYVFFASPGEYTIQAGSRVCVTAVQQEYESFNVVVPYPVYQTTSNDWVLVDTWSKSQKSDSFVFTNKLVSGKYTAMATGIYYFSANIIFKDCNGPIYIMIAVNKQYSKQTSLYTTKGKPSVVQDSLSVSGALFVKRDSYVNVFALIENDNSWSIDKDSTFSMIFLGYQTSVIGVTTVLTNNLVFTVSGWSKINKWKSQPVASPFFDFTRGGFNTDTGDFIAPKSGFYIVSAGIKMIQASAVSSSFTLNVAVNGNPSNTKIQDYLQNGNAVPNRNIDFYSLIVSGLVSVNAGDSIALYVQSVAATYTISQDSFISIVFLGSNTLYSSGLELMLDPIINQEQSASDWLKVKNWKSRLNTAPNSGNLLLDSAFGTVTVQETGVYYIFVNLAIAPDVNNYEIAVHTSITSITSLITRFSDKDRPQYTMKIFGALYLYKNQEISIRIKPSAANAQWDNLRSFSGWSFVRIPPYLPIPSVGASKPSPDSIASMKPGYYTRIRNWNVTMSTVLGVDGEGLNQNDGVYTAPLDGVYLISTTIVIETNESQISIGIKIGINADLSDFSVVKIGVGPSFLNPVCSVICTISITQALQLLVGDTVAVFVQSNALSTYVSKLSMFNLKLVIPVKPLENGFSCQLLSELFISSLGDQDIVGWSVLESIHYSNSAQFNQYTITKAGLYLAAFNIDLINLDGFISVRQYLNAAIINTVEYSNSRSLIFSLSSVSVVFLNRGDTYSIKVNSLNDNSYSVGKPSSSSLTFISDFTYGFSAVQFKINSNFYNQSKWYPVTGWITNGSSWLFEFGSGFLSRQDYIVEKSGFYFIAANIIFDRAQNKNNLEMVIVLNKVDTVLYDQRVLSLISSTTSSIRGGVFLNKLDYLQLLIKLSSNNDNIVIKKESTFSIVYIGPDTLSPTCVDNGPNILGNLSHNSARRIQGESISFEILAVGNVTYQWQKDLQILPGMTSQVLSIKNLKTSDSGLYFCEAIQNTIRVSSSIAELIIFDPYPVFLNPSSQYNVIVIENGPTDMNLLKISVRMQNTESGFGEMFFDIISGNDFQYFQLFPNRSSTGTMLRCQQLNREKAKAYQLYVRATSTLNAKYSTTQLIQITVKDVNDNSPVFDSSLYNISVTEGTPIGTVLMQIHAIDPDEGHNSVIVYSILSIFDSKQFSINPFTGVITLAGNLDRNVKLSYIIVVEANNLIRTLNSSYSQVLITLIQTNMYRPYWLQDTYNVDVSELVTPGALITQLLATDKDSGINAIINFKFVSGNEGDLFSIQSTGMLATKGNLSYDQQNFYELKIYIEDSGLPPKSAVNNAIVTIKVLSSKSTYPIFEKSEYITSVMENKQYFDPPFVVKANSIDKRLTIEYSIPANQYVSELFGIDILTGNISLKNPLDYEKATYYKFIVQAAGSGTNTISNANILVNVLDENDNRPFFKDSYQKIIVQKNANIGQVIYVVSAADNDSGMNGKVGYKFASGNENNAFKIDSSTGGISILKSLDVTDHFKLDIVAFDYGVPFLESKVNFVLDVSITDNNDNLPKFDYISYSVNISNYTKVGSTIFSFAVTDNSGNPLFNVTFSEVSVFSIKGNGTRFDLVLSEPLNFYKSSLYQFQLIAASASQKTSNTAVVNVKVYQGNRYAPTFSASTFTVTLSYTSTPDQFIHQLVAVDNDPGPDGRLKYNIISGNEDGAFYIDFTGIVHAKSLSGYKLSSIYKLGITAEDSFEPPKISTILILFIRFSATPNMFIDNVKLGSYQFQATISLKDFSYLNNVFKLQVLVQRFAPYDSSFLVSTLVTPTTWYEVNSDVIPKLLRYIAIEMVFPLSQKRARRSVININDSFSVVIGENTSCAAIKIDNSSSICNGPLKSGLVYRMQLRVFQEQNSTPIESTFSDPITIPTSETIYSFLTDSSQNDMVALSSAFGAICFLSLSAILIYIYWKQRHEIVCNEHLKVASKIDSLYDDKASSNPSSSNPDTFYVHGEKESTGHSTAYKKKESQATELPRIVSHERSYEQSSIDETEPSEHLFALAEEMSKKHKDEEMQKMQELKRNDKVDNKFKKTNLFEVLTQLESQNEKKRLNSMRHTYEQKVTDNDESSVEYESISSYGAHQASKIADRYYDTDGSIAF